LLFKGSHLERNALSGAGFKKNEFFALYYGLKKVQRGDLRAGSARALSKYYKGFGIEVGFSAYKAGFANGLAGKRPISDKKARIFYYASRNRALLESARRIEADLFSGEDDHRSLTARLGVLLGYPACCIGFFIKNNSLRSPSIILNAIKNTSGQARAELNILGAADPLISHMPCSFSCKNSLRYARKLAGIVRRDCRDGAGTYIYFNNGCFLKLRPLRCPAALKKYALDEVSSGSFGGSFNDTAAMRSLLNAFKSADTLKMGKEVTLYRSGKAFFSFPAHSCDWECIKFE